MGDRYLTVFTVQVEVVHDEHPDHFADLLTADVNKALRVRGCDDALVTGMSWREVVTPDDDGSGRPMSGDPGLGAIWEHGDQRNEQAGGGTR